MDKRQHVLLTTSRKPTQSIRTFCRDLAHVFPNIVRINRGKLDLEEIAEKALENGSDKVVIVDRWREGFGKMEFFEVKQVGLVNFSPTIYVKNVRLRRDFEESEYAKKRIQSMAIAALLKENFDAKKIENIFSLVFSVSVVSLEEAMKGDYDVVMQVLTNFLNRKMVTFKLIPEMAEIGPQMEISQ